MPAPSLSVPFFEAIGDYVAVLTRCSSHRAFGPLFFGSGCSGFHGTLTSLLKCGADQLRALGPAAIVLGEALGLGAHAHSVTICLNKKCTAAKPAPGATKRRLVAVVLDEELIGRSNPDVEHERQIAIYDLLEQNSFAPVGMMMYLTRST